MRKKTAALAIVTTGLALGGCSVIGALLGLTDILLLGVTPADGFADAASAEAGQAKIAVAGEGEGGLPIIPALSLLEVEDENGEPVDIEEGEEVPGHAAGSFVLLVDGSGSMENTSTECADCPTDPERFRVQAAKELSKKLAACGPDWRQSLMEFTTEAYGGEFQSARVLADFGTEPEELSVAAEGLTSYGGTPIWDATSEVLASLTDDASEAFAAAEADESADTASPGVDDWGVGLVVISDGTDTHSIQSLDALIGQAQSAGVPIHAIGLGPASDSVEEYGADPQAVEDLRRLAKETGGYYGFVSSPDELPQLAQNVAMATCGGYQEMTVRFAEPKQSGERVNGRLKLANTDLSVPFTFTAP